MKKPTIEIATPQFERPWELDYQYIPQNDEEFYSVIKNAPLETLIGMGFGKWEKIKAVIAENQTKPVSQKVSIPIINAPSEDFTFDVGRGNAPIEMPEKDAWILLFPAEWYNHIPEGFIMKTLSGGDVAFERGKTDDDIRFGCIAYGILKPID